jgi:GxxExxY protein
MDADLDKTNRDPETYAVIGAAMEVHRELGHGFLEAVYQKALAWELTWRKIPFEREISLPVTYKRQPLDCSYRADFVCYGSLVLELKAISQLTGADESQLINELKATNIARGLLLNFGAPSLEYKRFVFNLRKSAQSVEENMKHINLTGIKHG